MKMYLVWLLAPCITQAAVLHAQSSPDQRALEAHFRKLLDNRMVVSERSDTAGYRRLVTRDAVYVGGDGSRATADEHIADIGKKPAGSLRTEFTEVHVRRDGAMAIVDYVQTWHEMVGSHDLEYKARNVATYTLRNSHWLLTGLAQTAQPYTQWQKVAAVDSATLDDYVGRYEWWPGTVTTITRKGSQLYAQSTGDSSASPFNASSADVFYQADDPSLWVFTRDRRGNVTSLVTNQIEGASTARRLP